MKPIAALWFASSLAGIPALAAPVEWNGHFYDYVAASQIEWPAASAQAQALTHNGWVGHLATLNTQAENVFVATLVDGVESYPGDPHTDPVLEAWVGGYQNPPDEPDPAVGWTWVNGQGPISGINGSAPYGNWFTGEPNDWLGPLSETFMAIWGSAGYGNTIGSWNDEGGLWNISGFLVEFEPGRGVPDGGSGWGLGGMSLGGLKVLRWLQRGR